MPKANKSPYKISNRIIWKCLEKVLVFILAHLKTNICEAKFVVFTNAVSEMLSTVDKVERKYESAIISEKWFSHYLQN